MRNTQRRVILDEALLLPQSSNELWLGAAPHMTSCIFAPSRLVLASLSAALLLAAVAALLMPFTANAQESKHEAVLYTGAHDIRVVPINYNLASGSAQFAVFVTNPDTGEPVPDAKVVMLAEAAEEGDPGWAFATNTPANPERYDVHLKLDSTGEWVISVDVSSQLGADLTEVTTVEVPSINRLTQGSWVFFGMFLVILLGIAYVWWSARRDYLRKRASAQADSS